MREREEEIRNIHKGMHTVNEIYKDLAHLVDNQQEGVDQIEDQMENAKDNTASGLKHIEKANEASSSQCVISWLIAFFVGGGARGSVMAYWGYALIAMSSNPKFT